MLDGLDAMLSIIQMPPGIPVATVGVNGAQNAAILAVEMLALADEALAKRLEQYKDSLKEKNRESQCRTGNGVLQKQDQLISRAHGFI